MAISIKAKQKTLALIGGVPLLSHRFTALSLGRATTGAVVIHGARVGDTVVGVVDLTNSVNKTARFEGTVTVANQVQQTSSADDLSAAVCMFIVKR